MPNGSGRLRIDGDRGEYTLDSFHYHMPSEHRILKRHTVFILRRNACVHIEADRLTTSLTEGAHLHSLNEGSTKPLNFKPLEAVPSHLIFGAPEIAGFFCIASANASRPHRAICVSEITAGS